MEIARLLAEVSPPQALAESSRLLVVEPRSEHIARSLRAVGFMGELVALASVPIGERYDVANGYAQVIVDDWAGRVPNYVRFPGFKASALTDQESDPQAAEPAFGVFESIVVTDLSRYLPPNEAPAVVRWLSGYLADQGSMAVVDPAIALTPERLAEALSDTDLTLAETARVIEGDWPRTLTLWRREPVEDASAKCAATLKANSLGGANAAYGDYPSGSDPRHAPPEAVAPFRRERMLARAGQLKVKARNGSRITIVVARDGALLPEERTAISRYRLEQYVLANLYSASLVERWGIREDPSMALLSPDDTHFVAATEDGLIASYMCFQNASSLLTERVAARAGAPRTDLTVPDVQTCGALTLAEPDRPLFPVETEYGDLYARHPGLSTLPVASVREITRLVRNQRPDLRGRLREVADIAIAETIIASAHFVNDPANLVEAVVGCIAPEARQALLNFRIPVAYAPEAPICDDNLGGGDADGPLIWTDESNEVGRFWPFAISVLDLRRDLDYFAGLEVALNRPSPREVRESVNALRKRTPLRPPRFAASFTYAGYREDTERSGYAEITLPVAWVGLEARLRSV